MRQELFEKMKKYKDMNTIVLKSTPKNSYQANETYFQINSDMYRGTNFRGVSRNGRCNWQILTMIESVKIYLGTVDNILKAAILYDIVSI